jgi:hypothetical protein
MAKTMPATEPPTGSSNKTTKPGILIYGGRLSAFAALQATTTKIAPAAEDKLVHKGKRKGK